MRKTIDYSLAPLPELATQGFHRDNRSLTTFKHTLIPTIILLSLELSYNMLLLPILVRQSRVDAEGFQ